MKYTKKRIKSNYTEFLNRPYLDTLSPEIPRWRMYAIENVGWAGLTAPILYSKGYPILRIASSDTWDTGFPISANPFIDNNIGYAGIRLEHDLFDMSRQDKIEYIANFYKTHNSFPPPLTVCPQRDANCCACSKCLSTALGLLVIDEDPADYGFCESREQLIENAKMFLAGDITFINIERFKPIQAIVKERLNHKDTLVKDLEWLLEIDFEGHYGQSYEFTYQQRIPWKKLHKLFPKIPVPQKYLDSQ